MDEANDHISTRSRVCHDTLSWFSSISLDRMRLLAATTALVGLVLLSVGTFGAYTTLTGWDILGRSGAMMGLQPDHWRGHWLGTAVAYFALGLAFLCFAVGLWRRSPRAAVAWCITVSVLSAVWLALFFLQPLPYGFQQIPVGEVTFLVGLSVVSWFMVWRQQRRTACVHM
jgi:hypothetical protein